MGVMIYFKYEITSFGILGIGIALFIAVFLAMLISKNYSVALKLYKKYFETKFTRFYLKSIKAEEFKEFDSIYFFKNYFLSQKITLCLIYNAKAVPVSFRFIYYSRFLLEYQEGGLTNGFYYNEELFYFFNPISTVLKEKAIEYVNTQENLTEGEKNFILNALK